MEWWHSRSWSHYKCLVSAWAACFSGRQLGFSRWLLSYQKRCHQIWNVFTPPINIIIIIIVCELTRFTLHTYKLRTKGRHRSIRCRENWVSTSNNTWWCQHNLKKWNFEPRLAELDHPDNHSECYPPNRHGYFVVRLLFFLGGRGVFTTWKHVHSCVRERLIISSAFLENWKEKTG